MSKDEPTQHRVEGWESGDLTCLQCGKAFSLYFNGGELDGHTCCGIAYHTESVRVDLVVTPIRRVLPPIPAGWPVPPEKQD